MSLSLTNRDDIIANSYSLITSDGVVDLLDVVGGTLSTATLAAINVSVDAKITAIVGAAPAALNTLVELSAALGDDHNYASTITTALAAKAPKESPTFTGTATVPQIMFDNNSNAPSLTTRSAGTKLVLYPCLSSAQADYAIGVEGSNMWLSVAGNEVGNGFKFYGKDTNVATISGNGNFSCNGGETCSGLTVNGALLVGTTNVATALGEKATITNLDLKAPKANPAFSGTATAAALTVSGLFKVTGNSATIDNYLTVGVGVPATEYAFWNLGKSLLTGNLQVDANTTCNGNLTVGNGITCPSLTVGTTTEVSQIHCGPTIGLNLQTKTAHPIRFSTYTNAATQFSSVLPSMQILANSTRDVEILSPLRCTSALSTFERAVNIGTSSLLTENALLVDASARIEGALRVIGNANVDGSLTVAANLTVTGFYPVKPWIALYVQGNAISTAINVGFLAPSAFTMTRPSSAYTFTFTTPHPNGNNFQIFATARTNGGASAFFVCTVKVETDSTAGTKFTVWCRNAANAIVDGDFYVHTIP